jgi:hypothetical protein
VTGQALSQAKLILVGFDVTKDQLESMVMFGRVLLPSNAVLAVGRTQIRSDSIPGLSEVIGRYIDLRLRQISHAPNRV